MRFGVAGQYNTITNSNHRRNRKGRKIPTLHLQDKEKENIFCNRFYLKQSNIASLLSDIIISTFFNSPLFPCPYNHKWQLKEVYTIVNVLILRSQFLIYIESQINNNKRRVRFPLLPILKNILHR